MSAQATVLVVGTLDTKLDEILYLRSQIIKLSSNACKVHVLDVSRTPIASSVIEAELISPLSDSEDPLSQSSRDDYVNNAIKVCTPVVADLVTKNKVQAIIAAGGSTGTSLATALMRDACPIGFPKLMVSTMASGDVKGYIGTTDITIMYSVVDIAGLNSVLKTVLSNAAGAISGMALTYAASQLDLEGLQISDGKRIAITMFGVTTQCVDNIRKILTTTPHDVSGYEVYVFHATGTGSQAMERLITEGKIDAVVDLTTTDIADELFDGVLKSGPKRLEAAINRGIPMILSVGACDMINFGAEDTLPSSTKDRTIYRHNPAVTLMRTNADESTAIAKFITSKLKTVRDPKTVRVILPKGGVSALDLAKVKKPTTAPVPPSSQTQPPPDPIRGTNGEPWHDPEADAALFETLQKGLQDTGIEVFEYPDNINDEAFAISVCEHLLEVMGTDPRKYRLANARRRKWSFDHGSSMERLRRRNSVEVPDA